MAAPTAVLGGDLPPKERLAFEEGQDADMIPTTAIIEADPEKRTASDARSINKADCSDNGSTLSEDDKRDTTDPEKGPPTTVTDEGTEVERDPNIVDWDGPDDPANPQNWTPRRKWLNITILSLFTFLSPLASSMFAPGVPAVLDDLNSHSQALATFVVSVYLLGFAMGPLIVAPCSEMFGKLYVYHISNVLFVIFTAGCALSTNMNMLIGFRFLAGCAGVTPVNNGGSTIADLMAPAQRGRAMAVWAMGPLLGPVVGPVAGGYLAQAEGWRWIFWVLTIATGVSTIIAFFTMSETYAPTLLDKKAKRLRQETGNMSLHSKLDTQTPPREMFLRAIVRPMKLLFLSPICCSMCLYMSFVYSILYLLFTTFTFVFQETYGFDSGTVGLVYIGIGIGMILGLAVIGAISDPVMKRLARKGDDGKLKPEYRLPIVMFAGPAIPIGLVLYGWTAQYHVQWAVPLLGTLFVGVGLIAAFMAINTYLVDTFQRYAASAIAANTVLRSLLGATFPLFGLQMYHALGLGWGNSLLAFIALALCPIPWLFFWYGERLRTNPKFQIKF